MARVVSDFFRLSSFKINAVIEESYLQECIVSKVHYLLIFLIASTLGISFWLILDEPNQENPSVKKTVAEVISKGKPQDNGYVQGYIEVPDLTAGFKRCLNRGYNDLQKEVLAEAEAYFSDRKFETGKFAWNKVVATNDFGETEEIELLNTSEGMELSFYESENGKRGELKDKRASSLEELKTLLKDMNIISNEYAQTFTDENLEMTLILSKGIMKSLKIKSPKKSVTCKP